MDCRIPFVDKCSGRFSLSQHGPGASSSAGQPAGRGSIRLATQRLSAAASPACDRAFFQVRSLENTGRPGAHLISRAARPARRRHRGEADPAPGGDRLARGAVRNHRPSLRKMIWMMMISNIYLMIFAVAMTGCVLATPLVTWFATWVGAIDRPDQFRRIHQGAIPRLGGLALGAGGGGRYDLDRSARTAQRTGRRRVRGPVSLVGAAGRARHLDRRVHR